MAQQPRAQRERTLIIAAFCAGAENNIGRCAEQRFERQLLPLAEPIARAGIGESRAREHFVLDRARAGDKAAALPDDRALAARPLRRGCRDHLRGERFGLRHAPDRRANLKHLRCAFGKAGGHTKTTMLNPRAIERGKSPARREIAGEHERGARRNQFLGRQPERGVRARPVKRRRATCRVVRPNTHRTNLARRRDPRENRVDARVVRDDPMRRDRRLARATADQGQKQQEPDRFHQKLARTPRCALRPGVP